MDAEAFLRRESDRARKVLGLPGLLFLFFLGQSVINLYWAARISSQLAERIDSVRTEAVVAAADRYRRADADRDRLTVEAKIAALRADFEEVRAKGSPITAHRLSAIEYKLGIVPLPLKADQ